MIIDSDKVSSNGTFRLATDGFSSQFKNFGSRDNNVRDAAPYMCEELCAPATLWTVTVRVIWFTRWRHWPFSCTSTECFFSELRFYSFHCSDPRQIDHFTTRAVEFLSNDVPRVETRWFRPWLIYNQRRCFFYYERWHKRTRVNFRRFSWKTDSRVSDRTLMSNQYHEERCIYQGLIHSDKLCVVVSSIKNRCWPDIPPWSE